MLLLVSFNLQELIILKICFHSKTFLFDYFTADKVWRGIRSLNEKKAVDPENIPIKFMKMWSEPIGLCLTKIYTKCEAQGIFPACHKHAKIFPICKSGGDTLTTSYRPISMLHLSLKFCMDYR